VVRISYVRLVCDGRVCKGVGGEARVGYAMSTLAETQMKMENNCLPIPIPPPLLACQNNMLSAQLRSLTEQNKVLHVLTGTRIANWEETFVEVVILES
jgi:hypothetical protein